MRELDKLVELPEGWRISGISYGGGTGISEGDELYTIEQLHQQRQACYEAGKQSAAGERVDLEQFRPAVRMWGNTARLKLEAAGLSIPEHYWLILQAEVLDANRLLALIDSQKSGEGEGNG